jgi:hypothetical protein
MGDRNRVGIGFRSLESILGLLESLEIRAQFLPIQHIEQSKCIKLTIYTNMQPKLYKLYISQRDQRNCKNIKKYCF